MKSNDSVTKMLSMAADAVKSAIGAKRVLILASDWPETDDDNRAVQLVMSGHEGVDNHLGACEDLAQMSANILMKHSDARLILRLPDGREEVVGSSQREVGYLDIETAYVH